MKYTLVYQAGIANVFRHSAIADVRERCLQADFAACENFCRGLREAGQQVFVAWCNEAGDIATRSWRYDSFNEAPFCGLFAFQAPPNQSEWAKVLAQRQRESSDLRAALVDLIETVERIGPPPITKGGLCEETDWHYDLRKAKAAVERATP